MRITATVLGSAIAVLGTFGTTTGLGITDLETFTGTTSTPALAPQDLDPAPAALYAAAPAVAPPVVTTTELPPTTLPAPTTERTTERPTTSETTTSRTTTSRETSRTESSRTRSPEREESGIPCRVPRDGACVSISQQRAWLVQDGEVVDSSSVSTGRSGKRTPTGTFVVGWKNADHVSSIYDAPMPWSVFFNGDIAFHAGDTSSGSAGCVRLPDSAAETFFRTLSVGDRVVVVS